MKPSTRKVVTRSPSRTVRILNLPGLLSGPVEAESSYEAAYVLRASLMPTCKAIFSQPFKVPVSPKGYTPDFLQTFSSPKFKPAIVEIKPESKVNKYVDVFDRAAEFLRQRDYEFYVITDRNLFKDGIEQRAHLIRRYAKATFPDMCWKRIKHALSDRDCGLPLGSLMRKAAASREAILHFLANRVLTTGPRLMIDDSAVIRLSASPVMGREASFAQWFGVTPWDEGRERNVR
ncbi:MAG: Tn7 transposase TnsA N-terminal domain-containing protein [Rhodocyclaceae bacterium]